MGGSFDPPHKGHLYISKVGIKKLKLNKLIWIVTKKNPLKRSPYINLQKRIELSKKKFGKTKKIRVTDNLGKIWWVEPTHISCSFL